MSSNSKNIGTYKWGEVYKRVLLIDASTNIGIEIAYKSVRTGDGTESPLLVGTDAVGLSADNKLFFGNQGIYIKKVRANVMELGATEAVRLRNLSATNEIKAVSLGVSHAHATDVTAAQVTASNLIVEANMQTTNLSAKNISADSIYTGDATFKNVDILNEFTAEAMEIKNASIATLSAAEVNVNGRINAQALSAISLLGCDNLMSWW